jgi:hypothetical protein
MCTAISLRTKKDNFFQIISKIFGQNALLIAFNI